MVGNKMEIIIYCYMVLGIGLFAFNLSYLWKNRWDTYSQQKRVLYWTRQLAHIYEAGGWEQGRDDRHHRKLVKHLIAPHELITFEEAYEAFGHQYGQEAATGYLRCYSQSFRELAVRYNKRHIMDKSCFAYFVAHYWPQQCEGNRMLAEQLSRYMIGSTVYCRENVLRALCHLGEEQMVVYAFQLLNDYRYFHHPKLLADGLMNFSGDRKALAHALWAYHGTWKQELVVAVIGFVTATEGDFAERFFPLLQGKNTPMEVRLAILRYYKKYYYAPVEPLLQGYLQEPHHSENLGIVAASTLENYPSAASTKVLKDALHHKVWYIRHNAAQSLIARGLTQAECNEILEGPDRYASEMLAYRLQIVQQRQAPPRKEVS